MQTAGMTVREAAARFGVSDKAIRKWIQSGRLASEMRPGPTGMQYYILGEVLDVRPEPPTLEGVPSGSPSTLALDHQLSSLLPSLVAELVLLRQALDTVTAQLDHLDRPPLPDFLPIGERLPTTPPDWLPERTASNPRPWARRRWWWPFSHKT